MKVFRFYSWVFYFKNYVTTTKPFGEKVKFYHSWWLAPGNSKNHIFSQKSLNNQEPDRCYEIESKVKC